jgi:hypothetical protein
MIQGIRTLGLPSMTLLLGLGSLLGKRRLPARVAMSSSTSSIPSASMHSPQTIQECIALVSAHGAQPPHAVMRQLELAGRVPDEALAAFAEQSDEYVAVGDMVRAPLIPSSSQTRAATQPAVAAWYRARA